MGPSYPKGYGKLGSRIRGEGWLSLEATLFLKNRLCWNFERGPLEPVLRERSKLKRARWDGKPSGNAAKSFGVSVVTSYFASS
jgi:hypothetical protein